MQTLPSLKEETGGMSVHPLLLWTTSPTDGTCLMLALVVQTEPAVLRTRLHRSLLHTMCDEVSKLTEREQNVFGLYWHAVK